MSVDRTMTAALESVDTLELRKAVEAAIQADLPGALDENGLVIVAEAAIRHTRLALAAAMPSVLRVSLTPEEAEEMKAALAKAGPGKLMVHNEPPQAAERDRDALLAALGWATGPLGDGERREIVLKEAAGLRPAMVRARCEAEAARADALLWRIHRADENGSGGGLLSAVWTRLNLAEGELHRLRPPTDPELLEAARKVKRTRDRLGRGFVMHGSADAALARAEHDAAVMTLCAVLERAAITPQPAAAGASLRTSPWPNVALARKVLEDALRHWTARREISDRAGEANPVATAVLIELANLGSALSAALPAAGGLGRGAAVAVPEGHVVVPIRPTRGLLISMAMRLDHAFGMPPQEVLGVTIGKSPAEKEAVLVDMARLHEEIVGTGFYKPEREAWYLAAVPAAASEGRP